MLLSNYLLSGGVKPYLEYAWVCAPVTAGQQIPANTIQALTIDTEVYDTGNNGSIASNQITLNAGTYYFEAFAPNSSNLYTIQTLGLYNISDSKYETRQNYGYGGYGGTIPLKGQISFSSSKVFELRLVAGVGTTTIGAAVNQTMGTNTTAGADQRTTIKLWKLA